MKVMCEAKKKATQVTLMVRPVDKPNGDWATFLVKMMRRRNKKPLANSLADVERNVVSGESAQITPNEDARLAPNNRSIEVADRQLADNFTGATTDYSVANNSRNVNEEMKYKLNPEHEAQVRAYNEHITRLRQREEYLRGQGMSENAPAMINLRKA